MAKTFDPKCFELAEHFLADEPGAIDEDRAELAAEIQDCIEDFISDRVGSCRACGACPGFIGAECDETCAWALSQGEGA